MNKQLCFGVVILNYFSYKETINCLTAFFNTQCEEFDVHYVIVENGSNNESYDVLKEKYKDNNNVTVLKIQKNIGFAKGNNVGCDFLRKKYNCDYYIFSNSDILVPPNIFVWIKDTYINNKCDILGPDIYAPKLQIHQNPIKRYSENITVVNMKIIKKKIEKMLIKHNFSYKNKTKNTSNNKQQFNSKVTKLFDCAIHGSFIISNKKIFDYYDEFFNENTFLYMEEYLLFLRCRNSGLKTLVSLDNQVIHLQGKSTDVNESNYKQKKINRLEREIESIIVYKKELCSNKLNK